MRTDEFVSALRRSPEKRLVFENAAGDSVHRGYHITEIKAAHYDTVDCGGQLNHWEETIVQLWVPAEPDNEYMKAGTFLAIFDKVGGLVPLNFGAAARVEYGDGSFFPSIYHVASVTEAEGQLMVLLQPPGTTCKARDRSGARVEATACCQPAEASCCQIA